MYKCEELLLYIDDDGYLTSGIEKAMIFDEKSATVLMYALKKSGVNVSVGEINTKYKCVI